MSRIGKQPIPVPQGVDISIAGDVVSVKGSKGQLQVNLLPGVSAAVDDGSLNITRADDEAQTRSFHGLIRALLANATKLDALSQKATDVDPNAETPLYHAIKSFTDNFFFGPYDPVANWQTSYDATVVGIKSNDAVLAKTRIELQPDLFNV